MLVSDFLGSWNFLLRLLRLFSELQEQRLDGEAGAVLLRVRTFQRQIGFEQPGQQLAGAIDAGRILAAGSVDELRTLAGSQNERLTPIFLRLTGGSGLREI